MGLELYHLRTFWTFARIRHFTRTAEELDITQSAVSHALKKLERSVGAPLLERRNNQYELTQAGEALLAACERIFREVEHFESQMERDDWQRRQKLRLGAPVEFGTTILVEQLADFMRRHPYIHLALQCSHHLHAPLLHGELDLIVDCHPLHHREVEQHFLFRERYVVIATPGFLAEHPLRCFEDLEAVTVLSMDESGEWWDNFVSAQPRRDRTVLQHIVQINHVRGLVNAALAGIGVSFVPRYTVEAELDAGRLVDVFPGSQVMDDHFCIYVKRDRAEIEKNRLLIQFLKGRFASFDSEHPPSSRP
jgi:DNA-binding transcriptional LysR family regulator